MTFCLTLTKSSNLIPSSDTTKESLEKIIGEMAKMDSELREVKKKMCTSTAPVGESRNEGYLNLKIKVILLIRIFSRSQHVLYVRERGHRILRDSVFQFKQFLE